MCRVRSREVSDAVKCCLAITKTCLSYQHCFGHHTKDSTTQVALKKINSIQDRSGKIRSVLAFCRTDPRQLRKTLYKLQFPSSVSMPLFLYVYLRSFSLYILMHDQRVKPSAHFTISDCNFMRKLQLAKIVICYFCFILFPTSKRKAFVCIDLCFPPFKK